MKNQKDHGLWVKRCVTLNFLQLICTYIFQLTYADFVVACSVERLSTPYSDRGHGCSDVIPNALQEHRRRVEQLPGVKEWIATRPADPSR